MNEGGGSAGDIALDAEEEDSFEEEELETPYDSEDGGGGARSSDELEKQLRHDTNIEPSKFLTGPSVLLNIRRKDGAKLKDNKEYKRRSLPILHGSHPPSASSSPSSATGNLYHQRSPSKSLIFKYEENFVTTATASRDSKSERCIRQTSSSRKSGASFHGTDKYYNVTASATATNTTTAATSRGGSRSESPVKEIGKEDEEEGMKGSRARLGRGDSLPLQRKGERSDSGRGGGPVLRRNVSDAFVDLEDARRKRREHQQRQSQRMSTMAAVSSMSAIERTMKSPRKGKKVATKSTTGTNGFYYSYTTSGPKSAASGRSSLMSSSDSSSPTKEKSSRSTEYRSKQRSNHISSPMTDRRPKPSPAMQRILRISEMNRNKPFWKKDVLLFGIAVPRQVFALGVLLFGLISLQVSIHSWANEELFDHNAYGFAPYDTFHHELFVNATADLYHYQTTPHQLPPLHLLDIDQLDEIGLASLSPYTGARQLIAQEALLPVAAAIAANIEVEEWEQAERYGASLFTTKLDINSGLGLSLPSDQGGDSDPVMTSSKTSATASRGAIDFVDVERMTARARLEWGEVLREVFDLIGKEGQLWLEDIDDGVEAHMEPLDKIVGDESPAAYHSPFVHEQAASTKLGEGRLANHANSIRSLEAEEDRLVKLLLEKKQEKKSRKQMLSELKKRKKEAKKLGLVWREEDELLAVAGAGQKAVIAEELKHALRQDELKRQSKEEKKLRKKQEKEKKRLAKLQKQRAMFGLGTQPPATAGGDANPVAGDRYSAYDYPYPEVGVQDYTHQRREFADAQDPHTNERRAGLGRDHDLATDMHYRDDRDGTAARSNEQDDFPVSSRNHAREPTGDTAHSERFYHNDETFIPADTESSSLSPNERQRQRLLQGDIEVEKDEHRAEAEIEQLESRLKEVRKQQEQVRTQARSSTSRRVDRDPTTTKSDPLDDTYQHERRVLRLDASETVYDDNGNIDPYHDAQDLGDPTYAETFNVENLHPVDEAYEQGQDEMDEQIGHGWSHEEDQLPVDEASDGDGHHHGAADPELAMNDDGTSQELGEDGADWNVRTRQEEEEDERRRLAQERESEWKEWISYVEDSYDPEYTRLFYRNAPAAADAGMS